MMVFVWTLSDPDKRVKMPGTCPFSMIFINVTVLCREIVTKFTKGHLLCQFVTLSPCFSTSSNQRKLYIHSESAKHALKW